MTTKRRPKSAIRITFQGETKTVPEWATQLGILADTIYKRLRRKKSISEALSKESYRGRPNRSVVKTTSIKWTRNYRRAKLYRCKSSAAGASTRQNAMYKKVAHGFYIVYCPERGWIAK